MNFVDPKEIDIPRHGTKNRYKTILPSKFLELIAFPVKPCCPTHFRLTLFNPHNTY